MVRPCFLRAVRLKWVQRARCGRAKKGMIMNRRDIIKAGAAMAVAGTGVAGCATAGPTSATQTATAGAQAPEALPEATLTLQPASSRPPFVLLHGAWHGGWCWRDVAPLLRAAGHAVYTPTLTGLGERHHLTSREVNLQTHIADLRAVIEAEELSNVILVGHSYGGLATTAVADAIPERINRLIYLDAALPQSYNAQLANIPAEQMAAAKASLIDGYRLPSWPPATFDVPAEDVEATAWLNRRLTDMPFACLTAPLTGLTGGIDKVARTYISCTRSSLRDLASATRMIRDTGMPIDIVALDAGHDSMVTAPAETARLLLQLAG